MTDFADWFSLRRGSPLRRTLGAARGALVEPLRRQAATLRRRFSDKSFIGVTGSSGKTTTTMVLRHILDADGLTWGAARGFNGVGDVRRALLGYPRKATHIVLEVGAGETLALRKVGAMLRPDLSILTMIRMEHYSHFRSLENVAAEKGRLAAATQPGGAVLVNGDDPLAMEAVRATQARIRTFGQGEGVDYRASNIEHGYPRRMSFTIAWQGRDIPIATPFIPEYFWLPVTAAFAAAVELGVDPAIAAERIATVPDVFHRMNTIVVPDGPVFLLDTAKAPLHSLHMAFETVAAAEAPRKRIVLGMISDYAGNPRKKYREAYAAALKAADGVIFLNDRDKYAGASDDDIATGRFRSFRSARELVRHLRMTAVAGELILLKGSKSDHLERVALAFRQEVRCWRDRCGVKTDCPGCGLLGEPFETHAALRKKQRRARRWRFLTGGGQ